MYVRSGCFFFFFRELLFEWRTRWRRQVAFIETSPNTMSTRGLKSVFLLAPAVYPRFAHRAVGNALGNVHPIGSDENLRFVYYTDHFFFSTRSLSLSPLPPPYSFAPIRNRYWPDTNKKSLCIDDEPMGFRMFASRYIERGNTSVPVVFSRVFTTHRHRPDRVVVVVVVAPVAGRCYI